MGTAATPVVLDFLVLAPEAFADTLFSVDEDGGRGLEALDAGADSAG